MGRIIRIREIIIDVRRKRIFEEIVIMVDRLVVIGFVIVRMWIVVGYWRRRERCKEKEWKNGYERVGVCVVFWRVVVVVGDRIDWVLYLDNWCDRRIESVIDIRRRMRGW